MCAVVHRRDVVC